MKHNIIYERKKHASVRTTDFVFNQLIPYIGNKRKLLDLIQEALRCTGEVKGKTFVDLFAGSGVVARLAKTLGYRVIANDWEPYTLPMNTTYSIKRVIRAIRVVFLRDSIRGGGGQTQTALYRITGDLTLSRAVFFDNGQENEVLCQDAQRVAEELQEELDVVYLDPPYNQHPYGSNYHVLNSVALWDKPTLTKQITRHGDKSAIRTDWRTERRSAYNYRDEAAQAYRKLITTLNARYILTSYSTDGMIPLRDMLRTNAERGHVHIEMKGYKRYRVSSQRFSHKPMNVELVIVLDTQKSRSMNVDELLAEITSTEQHVLTNHRETTDERQLIVPFASARRECGATTAV